MSASEFIKARELYFAMDGEKRRVLAEELTVRHARQRVYVAEYAEANDDGSVRIVWIDGLHQAHDLEFDTSFSRFFRSDESAWKAAAESLRRNTRAQTADDLWDGITCHGFSVYAEKGTTLYSFAAQLRYIHTIADDDEKDNAMQEIIQRIHIYGLADDVCLRELFNSPDYPAPCP